MPVNKKEKASAARKNAEAMKAQRKQQRMTKSSAAAPAAPLKKGQKAPSIIKSSKKK